MAQQQSGFPIQWRCSRTLELQPIHDGPTEDPLAQKVHTCIKTINQGRRAVAAYNQELHKLACWLANWPEDILIQCFQDGLNDTCISWGAPHSTPVVRVSQGSGNPPGHVPQLQRPQMVPLLPLREEEYPERTWAQSQLQMPIHKVLQMWEGSASGRWLLTRQSSSKIWWQCGEGGKVHNKVHKMKLEGEQVTEFSPPGYGDGELQPPQRGATRTLITTTW